MESLFVVLFFTFWKKVDQFSDVRFTFQADRQLFTSVKKYSELFINAIPLIFAILSVGFLLI